MDVIRRDVASLLSRYQTFSTLERKQFTTTFVYTKEHLEAEFGDIPEWGDEQKRKWAELLTQDPAGGLDGLAPGDCGEFLLGLFIGAHRLPEAQAKPIVASIESWHGAAIKRDLGGTPDAP